MKEQLQKLYEQRQQYFKNLVGSFPHDDLAGPFLMSPGESYKKQSHRLLVVGQEATGWTHFVDEIEKQMRTYELFDVGKTQETHAFWSTVRKVEHALGNAPHSCAWTNLSRFDLYGGKCYGKHARAVAALDQLVAEEIKIVAPEVCIFFTGPDYDSRLRKVFTGIEFQEVTGWPVNQFCMLRHPALPYLTYRSYHPKSLKLRSIEEKFLDFITNSFTYSNVYQSGNPYLISART